MLRGRGKSSFGEKYKVKSKDRRTFAVLNVKEIAQRLCEKLKKYDDFQGLYLYLIVM